MRNRTCYLLCLSLFFCAQMLAQQTTDWIVPVKEKYLFGNSVSTLRAPHVIPASDGGAFLSGFAGSNNNHDLLLGAEEMPVERAGNSKFYFAKISAEGQPEWIKSFSGKRVNWYAPHIVPRGVADEDGGMYFAAVTRNSIYFGVDSLTEASSQNNLFVGHLTANGGLDAYRIVRSNIDALDALLRTRNGDLVVAGRFRDFSLRFDEQTVSSISSPAYFMARLTATGEVKWISSLPAEAKWRGVGDASGLVENDRGDLIMSIAPGGSNTRILGCASDPHFFVLAAFTGEDGNLLWQREIASHGFGDISDLAVAPNGDLYAVGGFGGQLTAANGETNLSTSPTTNCNALTGFLLKMTPEGMVYDHVPASQPNFIGRKIAFLSDGQYLIGGRVEGRAGLADQPLATGLALQRFSATGELLSSASLSGTRVFSDGWMDLEVNAEDEVFLTMPNSDSILGTIQRLEFPNSACFVAKLTLPELELPTPVLRAEAVSIFPNPATDLVHIATPGGGAAGLSISLFDVSGRRVRYFPPAEDRSQHAIDLQGLAPGTYLLRFGDVKRRLSYRVVKH